MYVERKIQMQEELARESTILQARSILGMRCFNGG